MCPPLRLSLRLLLPTFAAAAPRPASAPALAQRLVSMTTRAFLPKVAFQVFYFEPQLSRAGCRLGEKQGSVLWSVREPRCYL